MTQQSMKVYYDDGGWNLLGNVVSYPNINKRMDSFSTCVVIVRDFEGALYTTWEPYDFILMKIEDASTNIIFQGYLKGKTYDEKSMTLRLVGFGAVLDYTPFNNAYVLAEGLIKTVPYAGTDIPFTTTVVEPNGDQVNTWNQAGGADGPWETLVDDLDATYLWCGDGDEGNVDAYHLGELTITEATKIVITVRGKWIQADKPIEIDFHDTTGWLGYQNVPLTNTTADHEITFDGMSISTANLIDCQIRFRAHAAYAAGDESQIMKISTVLSYTHSSNSALELQKETDDVDKTFGWDANYWINNRDVGLLLVDNTTSLVTENWQTSAIAATGEDTENGNAASTLISNDGIRYNIIRNTVGTEYADFTVDTGVDIPETKVLKKIVIDFRLGFPFPGILGQNIHVYVKKNGAWGNARWSIFTGVYGPYTATGTLTFYDDLDEYLVQGGGNHTGLEGFRVEAIGLYNDFGLWGGGADVAVDYLNVAVTYAEVDFSPIMEKITASGDEWVACSGIDFTTSGAESDDRFKIGENTATILGEIDGKLTDITFNLQSTLDKYMARDFRGNNCAEVLRSICQIEGLHWAENHADKQIIISKKADFVDSGVNLGVSDYDPDWAFEDECNHYKGVQVHGNAALSIEYAVENEGSTSLIWKQITNDTIMTKSDAEAVANEELLKIQDKQPSVKVRVPFDSDLEIMTTVDITMARPTIAVATRVIRRMDVVRIGEDLFQDLYLGLGSTPPEEKQANMIRQLQFEVHRAFTDRLINTPLGAGASITWDDIGGKPTILDTGDVEDVITAELVNGQSIDNAADALIATHKAIAGDHHAKYTDAEVEALSINNIVEDATPQLGGNLDCQDKELTDIKSIAFQDGGSTVDIIRDEDNMVSDDANALATQQSIKKYIDDVIAGDASAPLMIGAGNAEWIPCKYELNHVNGQAGVSFSTNCLKNTGATDMYMQYRLPLPTNRGGKKLYVAGIQTIAQVCDADDYVSQSKIQGHTGAGVTVLMTDDTNYTVEGTQDYEDDAVDASGYDGISLYVYAFCTGAQHMGIGGMAILCYYDD